MANEGKRFERLFKQSAESQGLLCVRFNDSDLSFNPNKALRSRFTAKSPADFLVYEYPNVFFVENKSTQYGSISFERESTDSGMIHLHQLSSLSNVAVHEGAYGLLVLNFRHDKEDEPYTEDTYCMRIQDFCKFMCETDRKSITPMLIVQYGGIIVEAKQKRKLYEYNVEKMLQDIVALDRKEEQSNGKTSI